MSWVVRMEKKRALGLRSSFGSNRLQITPNKDKVYLFQIYFILHVSNWSEKKIISLIIYFFFVKRVERKENKYFFNKIVILFFMKRKRKKKYNEQK